MSAAALGACVEEAAAQEGSGWGLLIVTSACALMWLSVAVPYWVAQRDLAENLRWQAHMRGDHGRCNRKWPCDVPPEGGPPWRTGP